MLLVVGLSKKVFIGDPLAEYVNPVYAAAAAGKAVTVMEAWQATLGFTFVGLVSEAVVTETVFALPGIGRLVVQSILRRDYPVIQGIILVIIVFYIVVNLVVDIVTTWLDPRCSIPSTRPRRLDRSPMTSPM